MSAIFVADGVFDHGGIGEKFEHEPTPLPLGVRNFVLEKIKTYPAS